MSALEPLRPVESASLFVPLLHELLTLLRGLSADDWQRRTLAPRWTVRDIALHLLDGDLRRLSLGRDRHTMPVGPLQSYADVMKLISGMNDSGVQYGQRLSSRVLIDLLAVTGGWVAEHFSALSPDDEAVFSVAWAGEAQSTNWMDIARDYTERWHHQMQIRDAVGAPLLLESVWFQPLIDVSVRALPTAYREVHAPDGTLVTITVKGDVDRHWTLVREYESWTILSGLEPGAATSISMDADTAWRLLFNAVPLDEARRRVARHGDVALAEPLLRARSVMV